MERSRLICGINEPPVVDPVMWFDALFKAFHHQAIKHILPFPAQYDKERWWISQLHVIYSVELIFRGQTLGYVPISCLQPTTSCLSTGARDVFRTSACHYRGQSKQGSYILPKRHLV